MNKSEFIERVAEKAEMSKAAAARAVDAIFDTANGAISEAVNTAGKLSIPGFGKFSTKKRAARTGRNPQTGASIQIPERTAVSFTPGKGLREAISEGAEQPRKGASRAKSGTAAKGSAGKGAAKEGAAGKSRTAASARKGTGAKAAKTGGAGTKARGSAGGKK